MQTSALPLSERTCARDGAQVPFLNKRCLLNSSRQLAPLVESEEFHIPIRAVNGRFNYPLNL
jgi:hypothetical protein